MKLITAAVAVLTVGCGGGGGDGSDTSKADKPSIETRGGESFVDVRSEKTADLQCEALQHDWPADEVAGDVVYFVKPNGETYLSCGAP